MRGEAMKLCQYDEHQAGAVRGDRVFPIGAALVAAGHLRRGYTMRMRYSFQGSPEQVLVSIPPRSCGY